MPSSIIHLIVHVCLISIAGVRAQNTCDVLLPEANVYCVSPTEFTVEPPDCAVTKYTCPDGLFCTDVSAVCTAGPAACKLSRACNTCPPNALDTCVNNKQYVTCVGGKPDTTTKYCKASKPYCSMEYSADGNITTVCTDQIKDIACNGLCSVEPPTETPTSTPPPTPTPTPTPPPTLPPKDQCIALGKFKISDDITCKRYYYCYANEQGGLEKLEFVCPYQTLFDPIKGKCVLEGYNFKCVP